jgi:hypothetical protein
MRWRVTHQHSGLLVRGVIPSYKRFLCFVGKALIPWVLRLRRGGDTPNAGRGCQDWHPLYFRALVNCFTSSGGRPLKGYMPHRVCTVSYSQPVADLDVHPVRVMPWAVSKGDMDPLRSEPTGREDDGPAGLKRMLVRLGLLEATA